MVLGMSRSLSPTVGTWPSRWVGCVCVQQGLSLTIIHKSTYILLNNCYVQGSMPGAGGRYHSACEMAGRWSQSLAGKYISMIIIGDLTECLLSAMACSKCFCQSE